MASLSSSSKFRIPGFQQNSVLKLVMISGVGYVAVLFIAVCFQAFAYYKFPQAVQLIEPYIGLPVVSSFWSSFWTLFTYGWSHYGFWEWVSNMVWLYVFGSVVQMLLGHRQIIPMFFYGLVMGGIFYLLIQLVPGVVVPPGKYILGAHAGVTAFAVAALTLSPRYRLYLSETFSIPLPIMATVFGILMLLRTNMQLPYIAMVVGGGLMGFLYVKMLKNGLKPGDWWYNLSDSVNRMFTPSANANRNKYREQVWKDMRANRNVTEEQRVDELLDKINRKGYDSLTKEEREFLMRASSKGE